MRSSTEMAAIGTGRRLQFKLFMAYPGVFMLDDASIFKAMRTSAKSGGHDLHARGKWWRD